MKWTTTSAVAWSTAMMLLLATPQTVIGASADEKMIAALPEAKVILAGAGDTVEGESEQLLSMLAGAESQVEEDSTETDAKAKWEELRKDPELQQLHVQMKQLREQMRDLREKRLMLIAKKLNISTAGKTKEQIRDEVSQKLGGNKYMFHEKHVKTEERMQHQKELKQNGVETDGITAEELKAKMQEWDKQQGVSSDSNN